MSKDELDAYLQMPAFGVEEQGIARQQALADELRGRAAGGRMDWASQLGRGISGIAGGYMAGKAAQGQEALGGKYRDWLDLQRRKQTGAPTEPLAIGSYGPALA